MKTRSTFSLLFWVNTSRIKNDQVPIYARITVNGKRQNFSLQRKVSLSNWDSDKGHARGSSQHSKQLNKFLEQIRSRVYRSYEDLMSENKLISAQAIKSKCLGEDTAHKSLLQLFEYHNDVSIEKLNPHTLRHYKVTQRYLNKFMKAKLMVDDIHLQNLNYSFIIDFEHFLKSYQPLDHQRKMGHNTAMKHLQRLRKMVTMAYHLEWLQRDPFVRFKTSFENKRREFLTGMELKVLENYNFASDRLNVVRDLFVFSCYTGISYVDMSNLTQKHIVIDINGKLWIKTKRQKTKISLRIPLLKQAKLIIQKYEHFPKNKINGTLLPNYSNQKINSYLKEIAVFCGISKDLTFHMARHTFATTITLSNGVPIETVSKLLGHTKLATTQIYARVIDKKVSQDMDRLERKLNNS